MSDEMRQLWSDLGVNLELHDELMAHSSALHEKVFLSQKNRPTSIDHFDKAIHASHSDRVKEIFEYRQKGGKSVGTFCIYVPDEIAHAAGVLTIPLCGGTGWAVDYADKMFPRDICPLIRSTFGMALSGTCPYKTLKDGVIGETTCDAKKKAWDLLGFEVLEVPQKKQDMDKKMWLKEVHAFKEYCEKLSGISVTAENLQKSIRLYNKKRLMMQHIDTFRKMKNPPISGLDALLVVQASMNQDIETFINGCARLIDELTKRVDMGMSAYENDGARVLVVGTPSPMGYAKVHSVVEGAGMQVVADESCTGLRYYRDLISEELTDLDTMIETVSERYFKIDCACFSPNNERIDNIRDTIKEFNVDAVIHNILQYCHGFNVESKRIDNAMAEDGIPTLKFVTDYSHEDVEQLKVRAESFAEMIETKEVNV